MRHFNYTRWANIRECIVLKNPPGIYPIEDIAGQTVPVEKVEVGKYVQAGGYRFCYFTAAKFLLPIT